MALRFYKNFTNLGGTSYRVELHGPAVAEREIYLMGPEPVQYNTLDTERGGHSVVRGSEVLFEFLIPQSNLSHYDDLFQSDYKDWELRFLKGTDILFRGYVQPESISRTIIKQNTNVSLSATDALKDLSEIDFSDDGIPYAGKMTIMEVIKEALDKLGFPAIGGVYMDFLVKLNIHETDNANNILCFLNTFVDAYRFARIKSGRTEFDSCLEVMEEVLRPFHVTLRQSQGMYKIMAVDERNTYNYDIDWTTLTQNSRSEITDTVDITSYKVTPFPDLSYLPPIKYFEITHRNRNMGASLVAGDLSDWTALGGVWNIDFPVTDRTTDTLKVTINELNDGVGKRITLDADFGVTKVTDGDYIKVRFSHKFENAVNIDGYPNLVNDFPSFTISVNKPVEGWVLAAQNYFLPGWQNYESVNTASFKVNQTGDHNIKIEYIIYGTAATYSIDLLLKDVSITKVVTVDEGKVVDDITFDSFRRITSDADAKIRVETETLFGDSLQTGDLGALYTGALGVDNTEVWTRLGRGDDMPILNLWGLRALNDRQRYTEYLQIDIRDYDHNLYPESVLQFTRDGTTRYYTFGSYARHMRRGIIIARIVEKVYADVSPNYYSTPLTSIDGEDSQKSTYISATGVITDTERTNWNEAYSYSSIWGSLADKYIPVWDNALGRFANSPIEVDGNDVYPGGNVMAYGAVVAYADAESPPNWWDNLQSEVTARIDLGHLRNVNASSPSVDQALIWNGTAWVPGDVGESGVITESDPVFTAWRDDRSAYSVPGRASGTTGALTDIVAGSNGVLRRSGTGNLAFGTLVTANIGNSQVTYAKIQNVSATSRILGRITTGAGVVEELTGTNIRSIADVYSKSEADGRYGRLAAANTWSAQNKFSGNFWKTNSVQTNTVGTVMDSIVFNYAYDGVDHETCSIRLINYGIDGTGWYHIAGRRSAGMAFTTINADVVSERMRLHSGGGMSIGKTTLTSGYLLDVNGKGIFQDDLYVDGDIEASGRIIAYSG